MRSLIALVIFSLFLPFGCGDARSVSGDDPDGGGRLEIYADSGPILDFEVLPDTWVKDDYGCPPMPSCNWCGGNTLYDANGCADGYVCENGVDPCATPACMSDADCDDDEQCGADMLCWPSGVACSDARCTQGELCKHEVGGPVMEVAADEMCPAGTIDLGLSSDGVRTCVYGAKRCEPLPAGCASCDCLELEAADACECEASGGGIVVTCYLP